MTLAGLGHRENLRQHRLCHLPGFLGQVPPRVQKRVRETLNETTVIRRLAC
jgi:hypothetical protein